MANPFAALDRKLSLYVHHADFILYSVILYPFASLFHVRCIWMVFLTIFYLSGYDI
mgnify:CR=1 FL=1